MVWFFSGCDFFLTSGQFASGRRAFLVKNYEKAIGHFQKVADKRPGYVFTAGNFHESVWTYIGRCQYHLGNLTDARQSLEHALAAHGDDYLARLFLGLTLTRQGHAIGFREMEQGLKGLDEWIEYENSRDPSESFWDPTSQIRKEITSALATIADNKPDRPKLIETAEWIGIRMEEEIDHVRRDKRRRDE